MRSEYIEYAREMEYLVDKLKPTIKAYIEDCGRVKTVPINKFELPPEITKRIGTITREGQSLDECIKTIQTTMDYSLRTMNPFFMDKMYSGSEPIGAIAEWIVGILNTATHVYHVGPVFSVMEVECIKIFGKIFWFKEEDIDGTLNPGGTMSNIMAVLAARHQYFPHVRLQGWRSEDRPVGFTAS